MKVVFGAILVAVCIIPTQSVASPLACESIKDADQRHYCRAISIPRRSECEFIKNHDLRYRCRAEVK